MPKPDRCFYVYMLFRPWDGSPCYAGKGKGSRWLDHERRGEKHRNKNIWNIYKKAERLGMEVPKVKIRENLIEAEAFAIEIALIKAIGRKKNGGPLVNLTDGGDGAAGLVVSKETRARQSEAKKGKILSPEHCANIGKGHLGGKRSTEVRQRMSIAQQKIADQMGVIARERWKNPEFRAMTTASMSIAAIGNTRALGAIRSTETRAKMSEGQRRRVPPNEQTRAKMSAKCKANWDDPEYRSMILAARAEARVIKADKRHPQIPLQYQMNPQTVEGLEPADLPVDEPR